MPIAARSIAGYGFGSPGLGAWPVMLALGLLVACGGGDTQDAGLADVLGDVFVASEQSGEPVDLTSVAEGVWTRAVFVCPYDNADDVTELLGFEWREFPGRDDGEGRALFVFADGDAVVRWTAMDRFRGDPCSSLDSVLPRDEAVVTVTTAEMTQGGSPFLVLGRLDRQ
jgi:hypothetical protein